MPKKDWFVYMLRCSDNSLYTGITTDITRRLEEHNAKKHAKKSKTRYTRARQPVELVYQESVESRSNAGKREVQLKKLKKAEKEALVQSFK